MQPWRTPFPTMNRSVGSCVVPNIQWTWIVISAEQKITSDGRRGRKSYGVASESLSSSLSPKLLPRVWQAGSDTGEDGAGLWLAVGICPHTCPSSSLHGLQAMTDCVLELKTVHILWSLGGIPEFAIEVGRKPRIGLESKGDGKSQGININGGYSQRNWKGGQGIKGRTV